MAVHMPAAVHTLVVDAGCRTQQLHTAAAVAAVAAAAAEADQMDFQ